jgi:hypothetical protein
MIFVVLSAVVREQAFSIQTQSGARRDLNNKVKEPPERS